MSLRRRFEPSARLPAFVAALCSPGRLHVPACSNREIDPADVVWATTRGHGFWPAHIVTPASKVAKRPSVEAPTGHVYVRWLGEDYSNLPPEMLDASKVQGFDEGSANVWTMGASRNGGRKLPTANKEKFLRSLAVAMAFAPEAKRVRLAADALEGMTEEELSDASQNPTAYEQNRLNTIEQNRHKLKELDLM